jgi:hypothetical protein
MVLKLVTTTTEAIDILGGTVAVSRLIGKSPQSVTNYRPRPRFPADTYLTMRAALNEKGFDAHPSLWGIRELSPAAPLEAAQ